MTIAMPNHAAESPLRPKLERTCRQIDLLGGEIANAAVHFGAAANLHCGGADTPEPDQCKLAWEEAARAMEAAIKRAEKVREVCLEMAGEKPGL